LGEKECVARRARSLTTSRPNKRTHVWHAGSNKKDGKTRKRGINEIVRGQGGQGRPSKIERGKSLNWGPRHAKGEWPGRLFTEEGDVRSDDSGLKAKN